MADNPVTRFCVAHVNLTNGVKFSIVHDFDEPLWASWFDRWLKKTKRYTAASLIEYIKSRRPYCVCVTKQQFDEITAGKSTPATEAEWKAENFGRNE